MPKTGPRERRISIRGVIEPEELRFCQIFLAFGKKDLAEAYRRAFLRKNANGTWIDLPRGQEFTKEEIAAAEKIMPHEVGIRARALMRQAHIQQTLEELQRSPSEHARTTLVDNILFGTATEKKDAVKAIIAEEDKLGFRDAADKWAEIMCDIGAEVVVPLGVITRSVTCQHCGQSSDVEIDLAAEVDIADFFPDQAKHADPAPNAEPPPQLPRRPGRPRLRPD